MKVDRYGNALTSHSDDALDHYRVGMERFLAAQGGVLEAFNSAVAADEGFSIAHLAIARIQQIKGNRELALRSLAISRDTSGGVSPRELSLIAAFSPMIEGRPSEALGRIRAHLIDHPRDAMALQTSTTVFGLIGFSGLPGREAEQLALTSSLAPQFCDDWWFLSQHAFSQIEVGQVEAATANIERSYELNPRSAQAAHVRAHVFYESGAPDAGYTFLREWLEDADKDGLLHGHISWHLGLWALAREEYDLMWKIVDEAISPEASAGPPLVVMCDMAALLYRASLRGVAIPPERWRAISDYAATYFPSPGLAFGDVHASIAHAMAGNREALARIVSNPKGPAGEVVAELASGFEAIADGQWETALKHFLAGMTDHARIGGSHAQRDILEYTLCNVLLKLGRNREAKILLGLRRPVIAA